MPDLQQIAHAIAEYLSGSGLDPALREISLDPARPPAAHPHLRITPQEELRQSPPCTGKASLTLGIACSAGRPEDALAAALGLAQSVAQKLRLSHGLGGLLGAVSVSAVRQGSQEAGEAGCLGWAELDVETFSRDEQA